MFMELKGIDVSHWQGNIDWGLVKQNVDFAIIKAGGSDDGFYTDSTFESNYAGAKAVGLPIGAYYFVGKDFVSSADGLADADRFIEILKGKSFEYPVYLDIETTNPKDKEGVTDAAISFCRQMEKAGYFVGIYGSDIGTFRNRLDNERLDNWTKWVANYSHEPVYVTDYHIWQHSSQGNIAGIQANVDLNYCNVDYASIIKSGGFNGFGGAEVEEPKVETPVTTKNHSIGEIVEFDEIFASCDSKEALKPLYTSGKITAIKEGRNPYLINEGMGWINDNSITTHKERTYTVKTNDSLWKIAAEQLGNGARYTEIASMNGIKDSNLIYPGQVLKLPD